MIVAHLSPILFSDHFSGFIIGKLLGRFSGKCSGSIKSIARHPELPVLASCGKCLGEQLFLFFFIDYNFIVCLEEMFFLVFSISIVYDVIHNKIINYDIFYRPGQVLAFLGYWVSSTPFCGMLSIRLK